MTAKGDTVVLYKMDFSPSVKKGAFFTKVHVHLYPVFKQLVQDENNEYNDKRTYIIVDIRLPGYRYRFHDGLIFGRGYLFVCWIFSQNLLALFKFGFHAQRGMRYRSQPFFADEFAGFLADAISLVFDADHGVFKVFYKFAGTFGQLAHVFFFRADRVVINEFIGGEVIVSCVFTRAFD